MDRDAKAAGEADGGSGAGAPAVRAGRAHAASTGMMKHEHWLATAERLNAEAEISLGWRELAPPQVRASAGSSPGPKNAGFGTKFSTK